MRILLFVFAPILLGLAGIGVAAVAPYQLASSFIVLLFGVALSSIAILARR